MIMFLLVFSVSSVFLSPGLCQECEGESWLLPGSSAPLNPDCPYDGSLVPDCQHFLTDLTEYYHVHQHGKREGAECVYTSEATFTKNFCFHHFSYSPGYIMMGGIRENSGR